MVNTTYNPSETALSNTAPVAGQTPPGSTAIGAIRDMVGAKDVPNSMLSGVAGGLSGALGAVASATPVGMIGSALSALGGPDPALTTSVSTGANAKYGDQYMTNLAGASKAGAFNVTSGAASAKSFADTNAENRGQTGSSDGATSSVPWWGWALGAVAILAAIVFGRRAS